MFPWLLAATLALPETPQQAQRPPELGYLTAGELATRCSDTSVTSSSYCFAYIAAVHDTVRAYEMWLTLREFCVPAATPQADLRRAFVTYMSVHPEDRSGQAASVVVVALKQSYPCLAEK